MKTEKVKVDKNIPIPTGKLRDIYPWSKLEVGDSFFTPGNGARSNVTYWSAKLGRKFTSRTENGGVRVWRIQ